MAQSLEDLIFNVGGGIDQANLKLQEQELGQLMEAFRREFGMGLLDRLLQVQQDPFNIVNAVRLAGQAGGGPQGIAGGFAQTKGLGTPSPFGDIVDRLLEDLGGFAGANPINPKTGSPFTPSEMAFLRRFENLSLEQQAGQVEFLSGRDAAWDFLRDWAEQQQPGGTDIVPPEPTPTGTPPFLEGQTPTDLPPGFPPFPGFVPGPGGGGGLVGGLPGVPDFSFGRPKATAKSARRGANSGILRGLR